MTFYEFLSQYGNAAQGLEALVALAAAGGGVFLYVYRRTKEGRKRTLPTSAPELTVPDPELRATPVLSSRPLGVTLLEVRVLAGATKLEGAQVRLVASDGNSVSARTGRDGEAALPWVEPAPVTLMCAHPSRLPIWKRMALNSDKEFVYLPEENGSGSFIGNSTWLKIPGMKGQINPIHDDLDRLHVHPENLSINGNAAGATHFEVNEVLRVRDTDGNSCEIVFRQVVGKSFLIEHRAQEKRSLYEQ